MNPKLAVFCETAHPGISMKGLVTKVLLAFFLPVYLWGKRKKRKSRKMKGDKRNHLQAAKSGTASTDRYFTPVLWVWFLFILALPPCPPPRLILLLVIVLCWLCDFKKVTQKTFWLFAVKDVTVGIGMVKVPVFPLLGASFQFVIQMFRWTNPINLWWSISVEHI